LFALEDLIPNPSSCASSIENLLLAVEDPDTNEEDNDDWIDV
jgi:hypothetical protein